jgi:hypothetical protein
MSLPLFFILQNAVPISVRGIFHRGALPGSIAKEDYGPVPTVLHANAFFNRLVYCASLRKAEADLLIPMVFTV